MILLSGRLWRRRGLSRRGRGRDVLFGEKIGSMMKVSQ